MASITFDSFVASKKIACISYDDHAKNMLTFFYKCWKKGDYCDITIDVDGTRFQTHRMVLAMVSDYFRVFLQMDGKEQEHVKLTSVSREIFTDILEYAYTGEFVEAKHNIEDLVISSDYLGVTPLKTRCENLLLDSVCFENCFYYLSFSDTYNLLSLYEVCLEFYRRNFKNLTNNLEFLQMPPNYLLLLINDNKLRLYKSLSDMKPLPTQEQEILLLKAVSKYIVGNSKESNELQHFDLLEAVKLPMIEKQYIEKVFKKYSVLKKSAMVKDLLKRAEMFRSMRIKEPDDDQFPASWFETRIPMCFEFFSGRSHASGGQVGRSCYEMCAPKDYSNPYKRITWVRVWMRYWDGRKTIGGLELAYNDGSKVSGGCILNEGEERERISCEDFYLNPDEYITRVIINAGWMVDCIGFTTNQGNVHGPFGGEGGGMYEEGRPDASLHSISFASVRTQSYLAPVEVTLHWVEFY